MQYAQAALSTVSHNVVNANTVGYSRQTIQASASSINGFGNGVQLDSINRVADRFLTSRVLTATSAADYATTKSSYLTSLEETFTSSNASGGLESVVGGFITSMNTLANDPSNSSLRRNVVEQANLTAEALNNMSADLKAVATDADTALTTDLTTINQLLKDINDLNVQIVTLQAGGNGANNNDMMDSRDLKVAELSKYLGIQATTNTSTGGVRINMENGRKLVDESGYVQFSRGVPEVGSSYQSVVTQNVRNDGTLAETKTPVPLSEFSTGRLKALAEVRDQTVPALQAQVDEFTETFTRTINQIASQGTSYPPMKALTSGNFTNYSSVTDLLTDATRPEMANLNGATLRISVTNSLGNLVSAAPAASTFEVTLAADPLDGQLTMEDIRDQINTQIAANPNMAGKLTASLDATGNLKVEATDANSRIVMANGATVSAAAQQHGGAMGLLGMNNVFTRTDSASTVAVRPDLLANADLLAVARMRDDGGVSSTDGQNILQLAGLADSKIQFGSAGGLGGQNTTAVGYLNTVVSNLAVSTASAKANETFTSSMLTQSQELAASVSGVNINEELAQMIVYQSSFQASARIINVANDLLQELMQTVS